MEAVVHSREDLKQLYRARFQGASEYRRKLWDVLTSFFEQWIPEDASLLDLGCGYCEFINKVRCREKFGMDLNPDSVGFAETATIFEQDCSTTWPLEANYLDTVFTSNFFEHLPTKNTLEATLVHAFRCLKPGGRLIAIGPNVRHLAGAYWDFFDHYLPLSERSLTEVLNKVGFEIERSVDKFLPYTIVGQRKHSMLMVKAYLAFPPAWRIAGKQFLVIARKPQ